MRRLGYLFGPGLVSAGLVFWTGCSGSISPDRHNGQSHDQTRQVRDSESGHVHKLGDEHHSRGASTGHTPIGPNGGRLIVLGDEDYHAELLIDHSVGNATVWILDRTGRNPVWVDQNEIVLNLRSNGQPYQIRLAAVDAVSRRSDLPVCFTGTSSVLRGDCQLSGRLNVVIQGKPYTGQLAHREDDHKVVR